MSSSGRTGATSFSRKAPKRPGANEAAALRFCRARVRSEQELRAWLERRGLEGKEVSSAVRVSQEYGLLDDATAAKLWAEHWARAGYSWAAIQERLTARGFERSRIAPLAGVHGGAADEIRARRVIRGMAPSRDIAKGVRRLAARGFDTEVIERALSAERR